MDITVFKCKIHLSYPLAAALTLVLILDTSGMCLSCCIAAFLHEVGHLIAMGIQKTASKEISLSLFDINIHDVYKERRSFWGEIFVIAMGPLTNFILYLIFELLYININIELFNIFALSNIGLAVFNSLPVASLDGGNILLQILEYFFSYQTSKVILYSISFIVLIPMAAYGFILLFKSPYNFSMLFTSLYLMCIIIVKKETY